MVKIGAAACVATSLALVACSGSSSPRFAPVISATPAAVTTAVPAAGGSIALPQASNGQSTSIAVGAGAPSGTTITASVSTVAPSNALAPSARRASTIAGATPFLFVTFSVSQAVSTALFLSERVSLLPSFPAAAAYYAEFDDVTSSPATRLACAGPGTVAQLTATISNAIAYGACSNATSAVASLAPNHTYLLQLYYVPGAVPSPSASPTPASSATPAATPTPSATPTVSPSPTVTPTPTATPTHTSSPTPSPTATATATASASPTSTPTPGAVVVTPSSLYFAGASSAAQTFTASETGFSGTFTTSNTCSGYASVSGASPTFTVTPAAAPSSASTGPTCTVTVSNGIGGTATVNVYISTFSVIINAHGGRP